MRGLFIIPRLRIATATVALLLAAFAPSSAHAVDVTLEGEAMSGGEVRVDAAASGGAASRIAGAGAVDGIITTAQSSTQLFVRARGEECFGPPTIAVAVDGVERFVTQVAVDGYYEASGGLSVPAGSHHVSVRLANAYQALTCGRATMIDAVTIIGQPFSPTGWRNARLKKDAPIARHSKAMVAELRSQIRSAPRGAGVGTGWYGTPIHVVGRDQPTVRVQAPPDRPDLQAQWDAVPLPPNARPGTGDDGTLVLWQPSTDTYWDFWGLARDPRTGRWRARYGGRMHRLSRNQGHFVDPPGAGFGASGSSIMLMAGIQRAEELRRGTIDHAVDFITIASRARDGWCWPAQRTDPAGRTRFKGSIPAGARFRFPRSFDIKAYARDPAHPLSRYALTVALAIQRYGMVVRDVSTDSPGFVAEDPSALPRDPYPQIFEGQAPNSSGVLRNFPWSRLQVLAQPRGRGCRYDPDAD